MIRFEDVSFSYENADVLHHVSYTLEDGKFGGILGPNGGGKSTFLRLALGLLKPTSGKIIVTDERIGYLSQNTGLDDRAFPCTVEELIALGLSDKKKFFFNRNDREKIRNSLIEFDLYHLRKRLISTLSGGQLQRARMAKALISNPSLIVFDEPDAGMDEENHHHLIHTIEELHAKGKTILFVSHHPHDLERADQIHFIEDGDILTYEAELERGHHHVSI